MFWVIGTETYIKELAQWPRHERDIAQNLPSELSENPFRGKPLGFSFLREKRIGGRRIYYLVYEDLRLILLVATSEKNDQQKTIDHIRLYLREF